MNKDARYVTGRKGHYEIQVPVDHPPKCACEKCAALPTHERMLPHTYRLRRRSPFPDNKRETSTYAVDLKQKEEQRLQALLHQRFASRPMTLSELAELYFAMNPRSVSKETIARDRINAANLCRLIPGNAQPDEIDEPVVVPYRNARQAEDARPRTILNELSFLRSLLRFGFRWQSKTGMRGVRFEDLPKVEDWQSDMVALSRKEFSAVLNVLSPMNRRRMIFGVTTMLRRTPLFALKKSWVDPERSWLSVPAAMMKKGRSTRRMPLELPIAAWAVEQVADLEPNEHDYVWPSTATGLPLTRVHETFADCVRRSGVRPFSCHDLRSTGSSWLRHEGVDELVISILLSHRSTYDDASGSFHASGGNVTRLYLRVYESAVREAVSVFDKIRMEIDPPAPKRAESDRFESEVESAEIPQGVNYWNGGSYMVAHTGFEPVLPP
jgi:integrase